MSVVLASKQVSFLKQAGGICIMHLSGIHACVLFSDHLLFISHGRFMLVKIFCHSNKMVWSNTSTRLLFRCVCYLDLRYSDLYSTLINK